MARVYVAGPMRGLPKLNFPEFMATAARFRELGFEVLNPVEIGRKHFADQLDLPPQEYLIKDIMEVLTCDSIALLPGWENSTGACCEVAIGFTLGFKFYDCLGNEIVELESIRKRIFIKSYGPRG